MSFGPGKGNDRNIAAPQVPLEARGCTSRRSAACCLGRALVARYGRCRRDGRPPGLRPVGGRQWSCRDSSSRRGRLTDHRDRRARPCERGAERQGRRYPGRVGGRRTRCCRAPGRYGCCPGTGAPAADARSPGSGRRAGVARGRGKSRQRALIAPSQPGAGAEGLHQQGGARGIRPGSGGCRCSGEVDAKTT